METRTEVLSYLAEKYKCKSYLEIGVQDGITFNAIKCKNKVGVDPNCNMDKVLKIKSDEFFATNKKRFDLIFIDGDHSYLQVKADILNALKIVKKFIVCHDVLPMNKEHSNIWLNGGVFQAVADVVCEGLVDITTINTDHGCGILTKADNEKVENPINDWESFSKNRHIYNTKDAKDFISSSGISLC